MLLKPCILAHKPRLKMLLSKLFVVLLLFAFMVAMMAARQAVKYISTYNSTHILYEGWWTGHTAVVAMVWPRHSLQLSPGGWSSGRGRRGSAQSSPSGWWHSCVDIYLSICNFQESQSTWLADNTCQRWKWRFQCQKYAKQMFHNHNTDRPDNKVRCRC